MKQAAHETSVARRQRELEKAVGQAIEEKLYNVFSSDEQDKARADIARYIIGYLGVRQDWTA